MKNRTRYLLLVALCVFFVPQVSHGAVIVEQLIESQAGATSGATNQIIGSGSSCTSIPEGYNAEITKITVRGANLTNTGSTDRRIRLQTASTVYYSDTISESDSTTPHYTEFPFSTPVNLYEDCAGVVPGETGPWEIFVQPQGGDNDAFIPYGSATDVFDGYCTGAACGSIADIYFVIEGDFPDTSTRIVTQTQPANGAITPSTTVTFEFDYYWNDTTDPSLDVAGVVVTNVLTGASVILEESILTGENTFSESEVLMSGGQYIWRPFLASDNGLTIQNGAAQPAWQFFVESSPYEGTGVDVTILPTSTATSTNAFAAFYQGLNNTIRTNPPFQAVFEILDLFSNVATSTAAVSLSLPTGIQEGITDPLKTGFAWLLTIGFGVFALIRLVTFPW